MTVEIGEVSLVIQPKKRGRGRYIKFKKTDRRVPTKDIEIVENDERRRGKISM